MAASAPRTTAMLCLMVLCGSPSFAQDQRDNYFLTVKLFSTSIEGPLSRANVKITGGEVMHVSRPDSGHPEDAGTLGFDTDETGSVTFVVAPGDYRLQITHEAHQTIISDITVPPPGLADQWQLEWRAKMKMRDDLLERALRAIVTGRTTDEQGREHVEPLANANVEVYGEDGYLIAGTWTDGDGAVTIESADLVLGDLVKVRAKAEGFEMRETRLAIGSQQEMATDPAVSTVTSQWDVVRIELREPQAQPAVQLVVEVNDRETDAPVESAQVSVELRDGAVLAQGASGPDGKTAPLDLPANVAEGDVRVTVNCVGYEDEWSDVPSELLAPAMEPRVYLVHVSPDEGEPVGECPNATQCGENAVDAFHGWAETKPARYGVMYHSGGRSVGWDLGEADGGNDVPRVVAAIHWGDAQGDLQRALNDREEAKRQKLFGCPGVVYKGGAVWIQRHSALSVEIWRNGERVEGPVMQYATELSSAVGRCPAERNAGGAEQ